jgi:hypothetical protein
MYLPNMLLVLNRFRFQLVAGGLGLPPWLVILEESVKPAPNEVPSLGFEVDINYNFLVALAN